jgi:hypothetical protein
MPPAWQRATLASTLTIDGCTCGADAVMLTHSMDLLDFVPTWDKTMCRHRRPL